MLHILLQAYRADAVRGFYATTPSSQPFTAPNSGGGFDRPPD